MSIESVYRSSHPDVLAAWNATEERADEVVKQRDAFLAEHGFAGRPIATRGSHMFGVSHPKDQPIPDGWRRDRHLTKAIVPARRTAAGKKIGAHLDRLTMPSARRNLPGGMPEMAWGEHRMYQPGVELIGGAIYVKWGCDPEQVDRMAKVDRDVWERMKLSEYYAVLEAEEAAALSAQSDTTGEGA